MFSTIKGYLITGCVVVIGIIYTIFEARGNKIENLEKEAEVAAKDKAIAAKVNKNEKEAAQFVADNRVAKVDAESPVSTKYSPDSKFYI